MKVFCSRPEGPRREGGMTPRTTDFHFPLSNLYTHTPEKDKLTKIHKLGTQSDADCAGWPTVCSYAPRRAQRLSLTDDKQFLHFCPVRARLTDRAFPNTILALRERGCGWM